MLGEEGIAAAPHLDKRHSVVLDPSQLQQALPGFGVLQELKNDPHFRTLRRDLEGDSTPSLAPNEVPEVLVRSMKTFKLQHQNGGAVATVQEQEQTTIVQQVAVALPTQQAPPQPRLQLHLPSWARDLVGPLEQTPALQAFPTDPLRTRWLHGFTSIADSLSFLTEIDQSGAVVFDDTQTAEGFLELADIVRLCMNSPRPSFVEMLKPDAARHWKVLDQRCDTALQKRYDDSWWMSGDLPAVELLRIFATGAWHAAIYGLGNTTLKRVVSQTEMVQYLMSKLDAKTTALARLKAYSLNLVIPNVIFVRSDVQAGLVFASLAHHRVSGVAIVSPNQRLVSQVAITDFMPASRDCSLLDLPILDYLKRTEQLTDPVTCGANVSVWELLQLFATRRTHRVFVVSPVTRHLLGICTLSLLLRALSGAPLTGVANAQLEAESNLTK